MKNSKLLIILFLFIAAPAYADRAYETIEHSCDTYKKIFNLHYQIFWNEPAPSGKDFTSIPGNNSHTCKIDGIRVKTDLVLYEPRGRGMCGGVPGGLVKSLKFGDMEILNNISINSCSFNRLERVVVNRNKDEIVLTFCGSRYTKGQGEQAGCFSEQFKKSQLPHKLFNSKNFPYSKYEPNKRLQSDAEKRALEP